MGKNPTYSLIQKFAPMMDIEQVEEFEMKRGEPRFDVMFKQRDDEKTTWGDSKMQSENTTLRTLANNIYDYLYDDYEMWIRETPKFENGPTKMSKKNIRYVMALEEDNMAEDGIPLTFRMVSGWLVIGTNQESDAFGAKARRFYSKFGISLSD